LREIIAIPCNQPLVAALGGKRKEGSVLASEEKLTTRKVKVVPKGGEKKKPTRGT